MTPPVRFLFLALVLSILSTTNLSAQTIAFTAEDLVFFNQKADTYQEWLNKTGLGIAIQVTKVRLKKEDTELELLLRLHSTDLDTAIALWNRAKDDYRLTTDQPLEEKLFQTFVSFMEIPPAQGNVQLYVLDEDGAYIPCFYVGIWEEDGSIRSDSKMRECRDKTLDIPLKPLSLQKTPRGKTTDIPIGRSSAGVFDGIMAFLNSRYGATKCHDRRPVIEEELRTESFLRVSLSDLCRVVLTDEENSPWCTLVEAMGWKCTDVRRERLEFEFSYLAGSNHLSGRLVGKFGSGVYRPRKSGYMDMEPDFNDYLDSFHRKFQKELKAYLEKK